MGFVKDARVAFKALNGVFCVYKPAGLSINAVRHNVIGHISRDLNELNTRPPSSMVTIEGATNNALTVSVVPNMADCVQVVGPRYQMADFKCSFVSYLGLFTSGVLMLGINEGTKLTMHLHKARPTRAYKIHGRLGKATDTYFSNGRIVELATYKHVTRDKIDKVISHMQAAHQKKMYELTGLHMESQTVYEMAAQGLLRPANPNVPVLYGIKCVHFDSPNFTIEVQSINEYEKYLWLLIHELGLQLKSVAHCTGVQCIRQGKFTLEHSLLRKHWRLQHVLDNMDASYLMLKEHEGLLVPKSALLA